MHHAGTADDGTSAVIFWHRSNDTRLDGSVLIELVRGNVALRFEGALGRMYGGSSCVARFSSGSVGPCQAVVLGQPGPEVKESASPWRHSLQLALAVRPGAVVPDSAGQAALPTEAGRWRVSLAATHARRTDLIEEQTYADGTRFEAGIEAEYIRPTGAGRGMRWGAGARYGYGAGPPAYSTDFGKSEHVAFVPALLGWAWRSPATGEEIEVLGGIGPGLMAISRFSDHDSWAAAGGVELAVSYIRPLPVEGRWALVVGVGARVLVLWPWSDPGVYGYHAAIPIHVGLRF